MTDRNDPKKSEKENPHHLDPKDTEDAGTTTSQSIQLESASSNEPRSRTANETKSKLFQPNDHCDERPSQFLSSSNSQGRSETAYSDAEFFGEYRERDEGDDSSPVAVNLQDETPMHGCSFIGEAFLDTSLFDDLSCRQSFSSNVFSSNIGLAQQLEQPQCVSVNANGHLKSEFSDESIERLERDTVHREKAVSGNKENSQNAHKCFETPHEYPMANAETEDAHHSDRDDLHSLSSSSVNDVEWEQYFSHINETNVSPLDDSDVSQNSFVKVIAETSDEISPLRVDLDHGGVQEVEGAVGGEANYYSLQQDLVLGAVNQGDLGRQTTRISVRENWHVIDQCLDDPEFSTVLQANNYHDLHPSRRRRDSVLSVRDHVVVSDTAHRSRRIAGVIGVDRMEEPVPELLATGSAEISVPDLIHYFGWTTPADGLRGHRCRRCYCRAANVLTWNCHHVALCHVCIVFSIVCPICNFPIEAFFEIQE